MSASRIVVRAKARSNLSPRLCVADRILIRLCVVLSRVRPFHCLSVHLMPIHTERSMQEAFKGEYVSLHVRRSNYAAFHLYTQTLGYSYVVCREWRGCGLCGRFVCCDVVRLLLGTKYGCVRLPMYRDCKRTWQLCTCSGH